MSKKQSLSIVIPCFNEPKNVSLVIKRFKELLSMAKDPLEIIFVDGGSTDETPKILKNEFKKLDPKVFKLILMEERQGYGYDIIYGLKQAKGNVLSWTHADMQTDPKDVLDAFELYKKHANENIFIKGMRRNRKVLEAFFTFGMQVIAWVALKTYLSDINAQPKMFSKDFFDKFLKVGAPKDFSLDLFALYQATANHYKILTIPVYFAKRQHGEAKGGGSWKTRIKLIKRTFKYIFELKRAMKV